MQYGYGLCPLCIFLFFCPPFSKRFWNGLRLGRKVGRHKLQQANLQYWMSVDVTFSSFLLCFFFLLLDFKAWFLFHVMKTLRFHCKWEINISKGLYSNLKELNPAITRITASIILITSLALYEECTGRGSESQGFCYQ